MAWTEAEINERLPVWDVLSEFWLDGWLDDKDCERIATQLNNSSYSKEQIWKICIYEVASAVSGNLLSITGVWGAFDPEWLHQAIIKKSNNPSAYLNPNIWKRLRGLSYDRHIKISGWNKIINKL